MAIKNAFARFMDHTRDLCAGFKKGAMPDGKRHADEIEAAAGTAAIIEGVATANPVAAAGGLAALVSAEKDIEAAGRKFRETHPEDNIGKNVPQKPAKPKKEGPDPRIVIPGA